MTLGGVHSLKQTKKPLKMDGWKMQCLFGKSYFQGRLLFVSGRVVYSSFLRKTTPFSTPKSPAGEAIGCQPENPREQRMSTWFHVESKGPMPTPPQETASLFEES